MNKPTILTADDDHMAAAAISRDLNRRNGAGFPLVRATSRTHLVHRYLASL
jgi:hypothetical protein